MKFPELKHIEIIEETNGNPSFRETLGTVSSIFMHVLEALANPRCEFGDDYEKEFREGIGKHGSGRVAIHRDCRLCNSYTLASWIC